MDMGLAARTPGSCRGGRRGRIWWMMNGALGPSNPSPTPLRQDIYYAQSELWQCEGAFLLDLPRLGLTLPPLPLATNPSWR